jgi:DNA-binding response OmpR family regulator
MHRVLVVDDDPEIRALLGWKLAQAGYAAETAEDGEAALVALTSSVMDGHPPDLILVDWMMGGMTGIEVCQRLRDDPATAAIPIILLTSKKDEAEVLRGFAAGVDDYIVKPFSSREMLSRVHAVLTRAGAGR